MVCEWCGAFSFDPDYGCEKCYPTKTVTREGVDRGMRDYIEIGSSPYGESCAQVGSEHYSRLSSIECNAYAAQLNRIWPDGEFAIKTFQHDFGSYKEVVAYFYENEEHLTNIAYEAEANGPEFWDETSKRIIRELCNKHGIPVPEFMEEV